MHRLRRYIAAAVALMGAASGCVSTGQQPVAVDRRPKPAESAEKTFPPRKSTAAAERSKPRPPEDDNPFRKNRRDQVANAEDEADRDPAGSRPAAKAGAFPDDGEASADGSGRRRAYDDPELQAMVEEELRVAPPEERLQLARDLPGLDPALARQIVTMRRLIRQMNQANAEKTDARSTGEAGRPSSMSSRRPSGDDGPVRTARDNAWDSRDPRPLAPGGGAGTAARSPAPRATMDLTGAPRPPAAPLGSNNPWNQPPPADPKAGSAWNDAASSRSMAPRAGTAPLWSSGGPPGSLPAISSGLPLGVQPVGFSSSSSSATREAQALMQAAGQQNGWQWLVPEGGQAAPELSNAGGQQALRQPSPPGNAPAHPSLFSGGAQTSAAAAAPQTILPMGAQTPVIPSNATAAGMISAMTGLASQTSRAELQRLIATAESDAAGARLSHESTEGDRRVYIEKHVALRMLYLMAGQQERAMQAIPGIDPADQEFWQQMFWAVANYFDSQNMPDRGDRSAQTATQLRTAVDRLQESAKLELRNVSFCHKITSFGCYERFSRDEFARGQPVLLYAELNNFKSVPAADGQYLTRVRSTIEIYNPAGGLIDRITFPETEDLCRNHRRDYFHSYEFAVPNAEKIQLGPHVLKLLVEDLLSRKVAEYTLNFTVK